MCPPPNCRSWRGGAYSRISELHWTATLLTSGTFHASVRDFWSALVLGPIHALEVSSSGTLDIKYDSLMQEYTFGVFFFQVVLYANCGHHVLR